MNFAEMYKKSKPKIKCNIFDEKILFSFAPIFAPINAPIDRGIAIFQSTNPCDAFITELMNALIEKQASDDPIAIFIGISKRNVKTATNIAPLPIPSKPGNAPATEPIATSFHNLNLTVEPLFE